MTRILILCTGNSCRSQMAEYILRSYDATLDICSAGTSPAAAVNPNAISVMREIGISLNDAFPKSVDRFLADHFDYVITVCDHAKETCPLFTGSVRHRLHIGFDDPAEATGTEQQIMMVFRRVRDEIRDRLRVFYDQRLQSGTLT